MCEKEMTREISRRNWVAIVEKFIIDDSRQTMEIIFAIEGMVYTKVMDYMTDADFLEFANDYREIAPKCGSCDRFLFPNEPIIANEEGGEVVYVHADDRCCSGVIGYPQCLDDNGVVKLHRACESI